MKYTKSQIVNGVAAYIKEELLPKMGQTKGLQVILSVAVNAVKANDRLIDYVASLPIVQALLQEDGEGGYEIDGLLNHLRAAVEEFGGLPLEVPAVKFIAPTGCVITLHASDIDYIRKKIEGEGGGNRVEKDS